MIEDHWKRIAALWCQGNGDKAGVWMAVDGATDTVHLYETAIWRKHEIIVVVADSFNARGRKIPVAWRQEDKPIMEEMLDRGVNMLYDGVKMVPALAETVVADLRLRMRSGRFKVGSRLKDWQEEYNGMYRDEKSQVNLEASPVMAATLLALYSVKSARRINKRYVSASGTFQKVAIV